MHKRESHRFWDFFILAGVFFSILMIWLLSHDYQSDYSLMMWSKILVLGANDFRLEDSSILFPYVPFGLFWWVSSIPGLHSEYVSYLLSMLAAGFVFAHWNAFLVKRGYHIKERLLLVGLVAIHPFTLWGVTSGLNNALTFSIFYLFSFGIVRLVLLRDFHSIMYTSVALALFFLTDDRSMYLALVMFPFIPLVAPERMIKQSFSSIYVILLMPFVLAFLSWMYLNWMFHDDMFKFMHAPEALFNGVWQTSDQYAWLSQWGGEWIASIGYSIWLSLLSVPATLWMVWRYRQHERVIHTIPKLFLMPAIATVIGTVGFALYHAVEILYLQIAVLMASLLLLPRLRGKSLNVIYVMLLLGNLGGWWVMYSANAPQIDNWRQGLLHSVTGSQSDKNLAEYLNEHPYYSTLMDDRAGYRVIAAMNNANNLVPIFQTEVKMMDKYYLDTVDQFVTINPKHALGVIDGVGKRFEGIYWGGWAGYHLAYDDQQWRVYRRNDSKPAPVQ